MRVPVMRGGWAWAAGVAAVLVVLGACQRTLSTVFDIPPQPERATPPDAGGPPTAGRPVAATDTARPPIERIRDRDSVVALLPKDHAGNIDWVAAAREGIIAPRAALPGQPDPAGAPGGSPFGFDFVYPGPDTTFDARFPHSVHTEWLACAQCHPRIFRYRNTAVSMGEIFQGRYCAECHGKVSFPVTTGCERCHQRLAMPADRAQPELVGTIVMRRVPADSGHAVGLATNDLPQAVFPHWVHRMRYRCKACHLALFEPRAGANAVTMQAIANGDACGRCHNGAAAFRAGFGACQRCHVDPAAP